MNRNNSRSLCQTVQLDSTWKGQFHRVWAQDSLHSLLKTDLRSKSDVKKKFKQPGDFGSQLLSTCTDGAVGRLRLVEDKLTSQHLAGSDRSVQTHI